MGEYPECVPPERVGYLVVDEDGKVVEIFTRRKAARILAKGWCCALVRVVYVPKDGGVVLEDWRKPNGDA